MESIADTRASERQLAGLDTRLAYCKPPIMLPVKVPFPEDEDQSIAVLSLLA